MLTHKLRTLHSGQMLNGARNADGDVEFWSNNLAGLADLHVVGDVSGVNSSSGSTNTSAQLVGKWVQHSLEVLAVFQSTSS